MDHVSAGCVPAQPSIGTVPEQTRRGDSPIPRRSRQPLKAAQSRYVKLPKQRGSRGTAWRAHPASSPHAHPPPPPYFPGNDADHLAGNIRERCSPHPPPEQIEARQAEARRRPAAGWKGFSAMSVIQAFFASIRKSIPPDDELRMTNSISSPPGLPSAGRIHVTMEEDASARFGPARQNEEIP